MSRAESHSHAERWQSHSLHAVHVLEEKLEEMERDIVELIRQRDEAVEQRDHARDLACRLEEICHLTPEERKVFFEPRWIISANGNGDV